MNETKKLDNRRSILYTFLQSSYFTAIRESRRMVRRSELFIDVAQESLTRRTDGITAVLSIYEGGDAEKSTNKVV